MYRLADCHLYGKTNIIKTMSTSAFETILPVPDMFSAKRILCIQPHYDDNDIGAGATLALLAEKGAELIYLTVTDDLMGVVDACLSPAQAAEALKRDQAAAAKIIGVKDQIRLGYPDAGEYSYFAVWRDLLKHIRVVKPDFIFAPDPWLTYEAHRDHYTTGLAAASAASLFGLTRIPSSDPAVDSAYEPHHLPGIAFYFTREPNFISDVDAAWEKKVEAVKCYEAQFDPDGMEQMLFALDLKARQFAERHGCERAEGLKVLHPASLHCGI
jgi:LmbE family N-acetylglucosaminyl deacetylase